MQTNKDLWTEMHNSNKFRPKYPSEIVVQYVFRNFERNGESKVLDLGCGAGRHVFFMGREGVVPYGLDFSISGIEYTKGMLQANNMGEYADNLCVGTTSKIPFENDFFDGIICYGVLYYMKVDEIKKSIEEIKRVLKPNGKALIVIRSVYDYRYSLDNNTNTDEKNTFYINETNDKKCASNENGMIMHFFEEEEVKDLFGIFSEVNVDLIEESHDNQSFKDSNYVVTLRK